MLPSRCFGQHTLFMYVRHFESATSWLIVFQDEYEQAVLNALHYHTIVYFHSMFRLMRSQL